MNKTENLKRAKIIAVATVLVYFLIKWFFIVDWLTWPSLAILFLVPTILIDILSIVLIKKNIIPKIAYSAVLVLFILSLLFLIRYVFF